MHLTAKTYKTQSNAVSNAVLIDESMALISQIGFGD